MRDDEMATGEGSGEALEKLQRDAFDYFLGNTNPENGLVADSTRRSAAASIAAVGLALAAYPVAVERGFLARDEAAGRTLAALRFFAGSPQGPQRDATGHHGFFYHFLDMQTGRRALRCELSTIDTTLLLAGALAAGAYFEGESRTLAESLYARADWQWAQNDGLAVTHGWTPERGFLPYRWEGYSEALLLYALGLGSPTHPLPPESYAAWTRTYKWKKFYGRELLYAGPLFIHQLSHCWIDFRDLRDAYMRGKNSDYFENSRRATYVQREYAIRNRRGFRGYNEHCWGVTATDGPGPETRVIDGVERRFYSYRARGVPHGPDDGTIAPWAAVASLPFAPEIVLPVLDYFHAAYPEVTSRCGFRCSFNPTYADGTGSGPGWVSPDCYGLDQGPVVLMVENHRSGLLWRLMQNCPGLALGLRRAGFTGGWLDAA